MLYSLSGPHNSAELWIVIFAVYKFTIISSAHIHNEKPPYNNVDPTDGDSGGKEKRGGGGGRRQFYANRQEGICMCRIGDLNGQSHKYIDIIYIEIRIVLSREA